MSPTQTKEIRPEKLEAVKEIKDKFKKAKIAIFTDYQGKEGLPVKEVQKLRRKLLEGKGELKVVKNTLAAKALEEMKVQNVTGYLQKTSAIAFGYEDPAAVAKALFDFAKEHKTPSSASGIPIIKAALFEEEVLPPARVQFLATLPPKPILLAQLLGTMNAPITGLVNVMAGTLRGLVNVLDALRKQKEQSPAKISSGTPTDQPPARNSSETPTDQPEAT